LANLVRHTGRTSCSDLKRLLHAPASRGVASKLYNNGNYIRVRSFILSGAPPCAHLLHDGVEDQEVPVEIRPGIRKNQLPISSSEGRTKAQADRNRSKERAGRPN
jgi:hypothetical protein